MNLYLFNDENSASTFGIGTYLKELTHAFQGSNIHVRIVHLHAACPEFKIVNMNETENWYIPKVRNDNMFSSSITKREDYFRNVVYLLRLNIIDTSNLVFHFNYNLCQTLVKGLKEVFHCKTVITIHYIIWQLELQGNLIRFHTLKSKPENQKSSFEQMIFSTDEYDSLLYKEVDCVIAFSQHTKKMISDEYQIDPNRIPVIPNGLKDFNVGLKTNKIVLRHKWRISENEFLILFAGRLHEVKGLTFLIDAFQKVLDRIPESRLIIAGSGDLKSYLYACKSICAKVTFTGLLEIMELHELYQIADVGVIPSLFETFGYVSVEMMMHELPIVFTATSGLNEVIDETCGIKVPLIEYPDKVEINTDLLAEKIVYLLEHPKEAGEMGKNGRKRYIEHYSTGVFRNNMLRLYESLYDESEMNRTRITVKDI